MARKKLLGDIVQNPTRFYRLPGDVLRDRRFGDAERLEILRAWRDGAENADGVEALIVELQHRLAPHAAE